MTVATAEKTMGTFHGLLGAVMFLASGMAANAHTLLETALFSAIGASVGFLTTWVWKRIFRAFKIKTD